MKNGFILNFVYLVVLNIFLVILSNFDLNFINLVFTFIIALLYTRILFLFNFRIRMIIHSIVVIFTFVVTVSNTLNIIIKGQIITLSQVKLINELLGVKDTILSYISFYSVLVVLIPVLMIIVGSRFLVGEKIRVYRKEVLILSSMFLFTNLVAYFNDSFLYATVYNPTEYAQNYGLVSYYTREVLPFTKVLTNSEEMESNDNTEAKEAASPYIGIFNDKKNVVFIKAESFYYEAIDPELTPTLDRMLNDGLIFENYYTLNNNTNASEFSTLASTPPPIDNSKVQNYSGDYDTIPRSFESGGFCTFGFHGNTKEFYNRKELYPDLYGFQNSFFSEDLDMPARDGWHKDDLLFEKSVAFVEEQGCEKNFVYYMSVFGHSRYTISSNPDIQTEYEVVSNVYPEYDEYHKVYMSKHMIVDKMLSDMMNYYKEEIDDTIFIIVSDHYPYSLGDNTHSFGEYSQTFYDQSFNGTPFEQFNVPFIIYDPTDQHEVMDEYVSNIDILPTISDLFGLQNQYSHGTSAFRDTHKNRVEWLAYNDFGIIGEDILYTSEDGVILGDEEEINNILEQSRKRAAYIYSLYD